VTEPCLVFALPVASRGVCGEGSPPTSAARSGIDGYAPDSPHRPSLISAGGPLGDGVGVVALRGNTVVWTATRR
jgi:hypothetical protein